MVFVDLYLISVILAFAILAVAIYKDRKNIEFKYILFMRRTKRFRDEIDKIAQKSPMFWKIIGNIGIIISFFVMFYTLYIIGNQIYLVYSGVIQQPALQILLPTPSSTGSSGPGFILIPFWFWIIIIGVILIPHELSHGIIARAEKIKLKSVGLLLLLIFPGAFVEPDENQVKKSKLLTKLRIFSAGSFANFSISFVIFILTLYVIWPALTLPTTSMSLISVNETGPAYLAGLRDNMTITEINGKPITPTYFLYLPGFLDSDYVNKAIYFLDNIGNSQPGDEITIQADGRTFDMILGDHPNFPGQGIPYMGIRYQNNQVLESGAAGYGGILIQLLTMIWLFSLAVGAFNILPLYPLDGGLMVQAVSERFFKKRSKQIVRGISYVLLIALLYMIFGPVLQNL